MKFYRVSKVAFLILFSFAISSCACVCPDGTCADGSMYAGAGDAVNNRDLASTSSSAASGPDLLRVGGTSDSGTAGGLRSIHFDYKRIDPLESDLEQLQKNIEWLKKNPEVRVVVEGHCDRVGSDRYNAGLSQQRAENVRKLFISSGVDERRLKTRSMGRQVPIANPAANSAFEIARDRRVNLVIESID